MNTATKSIKPMLTAQAVFSNGFGFGYTAHVLVARTGDYLVRGTGSHTYRDDFGAAITVDPREGFTVLVTLPDGSVVEALAVVVEFWSSEDSERDFEALALEAGPHHMWEAGKFMRQLRAHMAAHAID